MTLAPTTDVLERNIGGYVAEGSGLARASVIPGNEPGVAPIGPYATVVLISEVADGHSWTSDAPVAPDDPPSDLISQTVRESIASSYSVQFFRAGARDRARQFRLWAQSPTGIYGADRRGLTFYRAGPVLQLNQIVSEEWEERAGIDLELGIVTQGVHVIDSALTLDIQAEFDGEAPFIAEPEEVCQ